MAEKTVLYYFQKFIYANLILEKLHVARVLGMDERKR